MLKNTGFNITKRLVLTVALRWIEMLKKEKKCLKKKNFQNIFLKRQKQITYQYEVGISASLVSCLGMFGRVGVQSVVLHGCRVVCVTTVGKKTKMEKDFFAFLFAVFILCLIKSAVHFSGSQPITFTL